MDKAAIVSMVRAEIVALKVNATREEKNRLSIDNFNANNTILCIYGQMTGRCDSLRAKELTPKTLNGITPIERDSEWDKEYVGSNEWVKSIFAPRVYLAKLTPLEKALYILSKDKISHIMDYIKDDSIDELLLDESDFHW